MHDNEPQLPESTRAYAHAKINLVLRVLAREASGYHGIETLFQALDLADIVDIRLGTHERTLHCDGALMPAAGLGAPEHNLAYRAAHAYTEATRWDTGWHIDIEKNIPVGGGLGGGSADAAAVLRALESLAPQPLGSAALLELAGTLGADVPFLVSGASLAWGWNRGDRFLPLPPLPRMPVLLLAFSDGVNTAAAYQALAAARSAKLHESASREYQSSEQAASVSESLAPDAPHVQVAEPASSSSSAVAYPLHAFASWSSVAGLARNDFEAVVPALHPGVARWLPAIRQASSRITQNGASAIGMMSGSGATCFLLAPTQLLPEFAGNPELRIIHTHTLSEPTSW